MPNQDMGTAEGRIRLKYEDEGSDRATQSLIRMQREMDAMRKRMAQLESQIAKHKEAVNSNTKAVERNSRAQKHFSSDVFATHKRIRSFRNDVRYLTEDLRDLTRITIMTGHAFNSFSRVMRVFNRAGQFTSNDRGNIFKSLLISMAELQEGTNQTARTLAGVQRNMLGWTSFLGKWSRDSATAMRAGITVFGTAAIEIRRKIFGIQNTLNQAPVMVQRLNLLAKGFGLLGSSLFALRFALGPLNIIERFAKSGILAALTKSAQGLALPFEKFGQVTQRIFGRDFTKGIVGQLRNFDKTSDSILKRAMSNVENFRESLNRGGTSLREFAQKSTGFLTGIAGISVGISNLWGRLQWFFKLPKPLMAALAILFSKVLPSALHVFGRALQMASNLLVGLLDGIGQLSGALATLPGLLAGIGAAITGLVPVFYGLKDSLKDIFSDDPVKAMEAWIKLPDHLKPLGQALKDLVPKWKDLQKNVQTVAFRGIETQIKQLSDVYFPLFERGALQVTSAFRKVKDEVVSFMMETQTQKDVSGIYEDTAQTVRQLARAIKPAAAGLRDMAKVGTSFFRDQAVSVQNLTNRFQEWAAVNRSNGNMMNWMVQSKQGAIDLTRGLRDLSQGLWEILTIFKTDNGSNFLSEFSKDMAEFEKRMQRSRTVGVLSRMRNSILTMGDSKFEDVKRVLRAIGDAFQAMMPFVNAVSNAFSNVFIPAFERAVWVIEQFLNVVNALGASNLIGWILGVLGAAKLLPKVWAAAIDGIKILGGAIAVLANKGKVFEYLDKMMYRVGDRMSSMPGPLGTLGNGMMNVGDAGNRLIRIMSGIVSGITIVGTTMAAAVALIWEGNKEINNFRDAMSDAATNTAEFRKSIQEAFIDDKGMAGNTVLDGLQTRIGEFMQELKTLEETGPGLASHLGDFFEDLGNWRSYFKPWDQSDGLFADDEEINRLQVLKDNAKRARAELTPLIQSGFDLGSAIRSSDKEFARIIGDLRVQGKVSQETADLIEGLREEYKAAERDAKALGPAGAMAAEGFKMLAEAAGDANQKLDGLRQVLVALGVIKTDTLAATSEYANAIANLGESVKQAIEDGDGLENLFAGGTLNVGGSQTARNLLPVFQELSDTFMNLASNGGNVDEMMAQIDAQLNTVAEQLGTTKENLKNMLTTSFGFVPDIVKIAVQLDGKDELTQQMGTLLLHLMGMAQSGVFVPVTFTGKSGEDIENIEKEFEKIVGRDIFVTQGTNITLIPGVQPPSAAETAKINQWLKDKGFTPIGQQPSPNSPQIVPQITPPAGPGNAPAQQGPAAAPAGATPESKEALDQFLQELSGMTDAATNQARESGSELVDAYAEGIKNNPAASDALKRLLEEMLKNVHRSPPKKGPLAKHGDAAKYAGQQFGSSYATGITSGEREVASATSGLAGEASGALRGDKMYETGKFFGEISRLVNFAENAVNAFSQLTETILNAGKFMSDPLGKGTFFGNRRRWVRDPNISDEALRRQQEDAAQSRLFNAMGTGARDLEGIDQYGFQKIKDPGKLGRDASKNDIIAAIIAEGQRRGMNPAQIQGAIAGALVESGAQNLNYGPDGSLGVFQEIPIYGSAETRLDPNAAISRFYDRYAPVAAGITDPTKIGEAVADAQRPREDLRGKYQERMAEAIKEYQQALASGGVTPTVSDRALPIPGFGETNRPSNVTGGQNQNVVDIAAAVINSLFPEMQGSTMGGQRPDAKPYHREGRALDVMIPNWNTPEGKALGTKIRDFFLANAEKFGVEDTIWQQFWQPPGGAGNKMGDQGSATANHMDHVHITFKDGATANIGPNGTELNVPVNSGVPKEAFKLPSALTDNKPSDPKRRWVKNPDGNFTEVTPHGEGGALPPGEINVQTGKPYTDDEIKALQEQYPIQYDLSDLKPGDLELGGAFQGTQEQLLDEAKANNKTLSQALAALENPALSEGEVANALSIVDAEAARQKTLDTPQSRALASQLESKVSTAASERGLTQEQNPFDKAAEIAGAATSIAGDVFQVINSVIESIDATKQITDQLVRGVSNTEDIFNLVDRIQTYIQLGADIAGAVASVSGAIGSLVGAAGGADPSGGASGAATAIQAVSQIAGLVQSGFETANAIIDLAQEAYRIIGSYVGQYLGYLVGGPEGLMGDVKFLLDEQSNQLLAYSADNPLDKRAHDFAFQEGDPNARNQLIGNVNVYGGPGRDPRDDTRQMMWQVSTAGMMTAVGQ